MKNSYSIHTVRTQFCHLMHALILILFIWVMIVYFKSPLTLIELHHFLAPLTNGVASFIPYIQWLKDVSHVPELTQAFVTMIYLCFVMLFVNLSIVIFPAFVGAPQRNYRLSINGFADFLEENIYCRLSPSVSLVVPSERLWGRSIRGRQMIETDSFKQLVVIYLKKYAVAYYGGLAFAGFVFFPWVAYNKVNIISMSSVPFWLAVIVFSYTQVRWVFELSVLLSTLFKKP